MFRACKIRHTFTPAVLSSRYGRLRTWTSVTTTRDSAIVDALKTPFSYVWLRDSCQAPESIHPSTSQKLHRTSDVPLDILPKDLTEGEVIQLNQAASTGIRVVPEGLEITWNDGHKSSFTPNFLKNHATPSSLQKFHLSEHTSPVAWTSSTIPKSAKLYVTYASLNDPEGLVEAMTQLLKYGLIFVSGVPTEHKGNDTCELKVLAEKFGEIRRTFYGELWDVINIQNSKNIAYTNLDLGLHMDLLYFHNPPKFQALHCLRNRVVGGASYFVDSLHAAHSLFHSNRPHFDILTQTPVAFQYLNDGHHLYKQHPTIQLEHPSGGPLAADSSTPPSISHINYSPPFQGPLPVGTPKEFYAALKEFTGILNDPKNTYTYTLKEGDCVLFDNRRVLHARTAFEEKPEGEREGGIFFGDGQDRTNRWLKGCYLEADAVADRMRTGRAKYF